MLMRNKTEKKKPWTSQIIGYSTSPQSINPESFPKPAKKFSKPEPL